MMNDERLVSCSLFLPCESQPTPAVDNCSDSELTGEGYETPPQNELELLNPFWEDRRILPTSPMTWDSNQLQKDAVEEQRSSRAETTQDSLSWTLSVEASSPPPLYRYSPPSPMSSSLGYCPQEKWNGQYKGCLPLKDFMKAYKEPDETQRGNYCSHVKLPQGAYVTDNTNSSPWNQRYDEEEYSDSVETKHSSTDGLSKPTIYITEITAHSANKPTLKRAKLTECCQVM
ncbi:hypothetical protein GpartN1_g7540.t1 [Galdieria partita]|uniref:Uncharacterized protein n=1 Tax=Galdieria partita TaxID=83374 RepID=A0A9C7Q3Q7_9RHOD|nr:hypothetical protein GpartN1_g7540.t1 [Galdieria partita]